MYSIVLVDGSKFLTMSRFLKLMCLILFVVTLFGCSVKDKSYIIPANYTSEALVKVFTDKTEDLYKVGIICRDGNYSFTVNAENTKWNIAFLSDGRCILSNEKFHDGSIIINDFKIADSLISDFDLSKFNNLSDSIPEELIYWDGAFKHVLKFDKENLLPGTIFIYKKNNLVKAIQYDKINIEE